MLVCGCNNSQCLAHFGSEDTIDGWLDLVLPIGAIYRHIANDSRIPDYGLHRVLCVTIDYGVMFVGSGGTTLPPMCVYAWQTHWLSGGKVGRPHECCISMGKAHLVLQWPKLLWSQLLIDHLYFFARKWRVLSHVSCFAMEVSHPRLKCMLRNSGGLSLLRGCLGVQVVVDNHTIDGSRRLQGWDVTKRSMRGQGPVTMRQSAWRARKRAFNELNYVHVLS